MIHALVTSHIDYCKAFYCLPHKIIHKLQLIQNSDAQIISRTPLVEHITPVLQQLHWLPVKQQIEIKMKTYLLLICLTVFSYTFPLKLLDHHCDSL